MDVEDGVIWVCGLDDDGSILALTEFGVETLVELVRTHREITPSKRR